MMLPTGQSLPQGRIPEVVSDKLHFQALRCQLGKGRSGGGERSGVEGGEIGGERPKGVLAYALFDEGTQGRDIPVCEQGRELIAALKWKHAYERVQRVGARELAIRPEGRAVQG